MVFFIIELISVCFYKLIITTDILMKAILNHEGRENITPNRNNVAHPSHQTQQKAFKPTIKVGYIHMSKDIEQKRHRKQIIINKTLKTQRNGVKQVQNKQKNSGKFIESYYDSSLNSDKQHKFHKKNVEEAYQKYRSGKQFSQQLQNQFNPTSRSSRSINNGLQRVATERSKLSGYKNQGIKDIVQYKHASSFRKEDVSAKCNSYLPIKRSFKFQELHDVDFRKTKIRLI